MTTPMLFRLSRWAIGACIAVEVLAMLVYPGGTVRDPGATRYSFSQNFISDLGMTVTHGGHPNRLGAGLFTVGFTALSFAVIACALGFVRLHGSSLRGRQVSRVAAAGGMLAGACLLGTAVSPANLAAPLHMWFAAAASAIAPPSLLLCAVASARDRRFHAGVSIAWMLLAFAVGAWFAMRWGPAITTAGGLTVKASVQKAVAIVVVGVVTYQTYQGSAVDGRELDPPAAPAPGLRHLANR